MDSTSAKVAACTLSDFSTNSQNTAQKSLAPISCNSELQSIAKIRRVSNDCGNLKKLSEKNGLSQNNQIDSLKS